MAVLYRKKDDFEAALECIDKALLLDPNDPMYLCNRAIILNRMGMQKEAGLDIMAAARLFH